MIHTDGVRTIANHPGSTRARNTLAANRSRKRPVPEALREARRVPADAPRSRLEAAEERARQAAPNSDARYAAETAAAGLRRMAARDTGDRFPIDPASPHGGHVEGSRKQHGDPLREADTPLVYIDRRTGEMHGDALTGRRS